MAAPNDLPLDELLKLASADALSDLHTALPCVVVRYDANTKRADLRPGVRRALKGQEGEDVYEDLPTIPNVPVAWLGAGGFFMHLPLEPGDSGWLLFSEADAQRWYASGEVSDPREKARHTLGSPMFLPTPRVQPETAGAFLACPSAFSFGDPTTAKLVAIAEKVDALGDTIKTWANSHTHPVPSLGTSSPTATPLGTLPQTAGTKVKSE